MTKYHAVQTYSELCGRTFSSKAECARAEELMLLERAGEITDLQFQVKYVLNEKPKISITLDFVYKENGEMVYEDYKGVLTRDFRTKIYWLKSKFGITVLLTGKTPRLNPLGALGRHRREGLNKLQPPSDGLCQICHQPPDFRGLSRHHIKKRSQGGNESKENIMWLCGKCHDKEHHIVDR